MTDAELKAAREALNSPIVAGSVLAFLGRELLAEIDARAARAQQLEAALNKIADVMRLREPDDFLLSEIQDYLTMAGYDVPLRGYR